MNADEQERIMKQNDKDYGDWVCVIRCKDCKHYGSKRGACHNPRYGDGHVNYPPPYVRDDFYCADGERKETNER